MKSIFNYIVLASVAAVALVSCTKEQPAPEESSTPAMKTITITTDVRTKTTLDATHENLGWSTGDQISVFNNIDDDNAQLTYAPGDYMTVTVPAGTSEVYGHYPYYSGNTSGPSSVSIYINKNQTQENPGELNGYYYPMVAKGDVIGDKANMVFYPVASALALNIYNTGLAGTEKVSRIVVTPTANTYYIGRQTTNITGSGIKYTTTTSTDPITVTLTNALTLGDSKPADSQTFDGQIYVCLAKQSYASVQFEISTTKGVYTITSNSTPFDCANHDFIPVNIDLAAASFTPVLSEPTAKTGWYRVEDASWLAAGDRVAIVANGYDVAASSADNGNNRKSVAVTKTTDDGYAKMTFTTSVQEFILEDGTKGGSFGFWCDNGAKPNYYIYAASSGSNYMKSQEDLDDNASFAVTVAGGVATVIAQGTNTRNIIKYNDSSDLFSCYASGQKDIAIYKYYGGSTPTCSTPTISLTGATVTITSTGGATIYYTTDGSTPTDASTEYTAPFDIDATVTVKAIAVRAHYNNSAVASEECVPVITCATPVITGTGTSFTITCVTDGATIYYETSTTDLASVATPTTSSSVYSSAVPIAATTYVKAYAVKAGCTDSAVASETCVYGSSASETIVFSEKGYSNAEEVTNVSGSVIYLVFAKDSGSNAPKYYDTGSGVRTYNGNTITVTASSKTITKIEFTFQDGYSMNCSVSPGSYSDGTWTGSGTSVVFTSSNTNRIQSIKVTYIN